MKANATFVKTSLCICGETILRDEIPLGKRYQVLSMGEEGKLVCGGCGKETKVTLCAVVDECNNAGVMPLEIFDLDKGLS